MPPHSTAADPPETAEGWFALHQIFRVDRAGIRAMPRADVDAAATSLGHALAAMAGPEEGGWTAAARLVGNAADLMLVHFRPTLDALGSVQDRLAREPLRDHLEPVYSFLSVAEVGLYQLTAEVTRAALDRGGQVGDDEYRAALAARVRAEVASPHIARRLYPELPREMPYVCFYPMSKRRSEGQNWYTLPLEERNRLMRAHGLTGRRFAGRVQQVITGAIGLDAWEWGVTLFAKDPLDFKKLVTDMRYDEVSALYADFGQFYVGRLEPPGVWAVLGG